MDAYMAIGLDLRTSMMVLLNVQIEDAVPLVSKARSMFCQLGWQTSGCRTLCVHAATPGGRQKSNDPLRSIRQTDGTRALREKQLGGAPLCRNRYTVYKFRSMSITIVCIGRHYSSFSTPEMWSRYLSPVATLRQLDSKAHDVETCYFNLWPDHDLTCDWPN